MLAPIITSFAEFLFYLTNGFAISSGMLFLPYLILMGIFMVFIVLSIDLVNTNLAKLLLMGTAIFIFTIALSVPITQEQMLTECTQFEQPYETENTNGTFIIKECKIKPNYFDDEFYWKSYVRN